MAIYGAINEERKLIGYHDKRKVVERFIEQEKQYALVKLKRHMKKRLEEDVDGVELLLVRCGEQYVPYHLYETLKEMNEESNYDFTVCKDVLSRELMISNPKEAKILNKALKIITKRMRNLKRDVYLVDDLKNMQNLNKEYQERVR